MDFNKRKPYKFLKRNNAHTIPKDKLVQQAKDLEKKLVSKGDREVKHGKDTIKI